MIKFFIILVALVALAATADPLPELNALNPTGRIVVGEATTIEQVPWQVSVQAFNIHICGGSIIGNFWILTAAHCMMYPRMWYTIRSGSSFSNNGGVVSNIAFALVNEGYTVVDAIPVHNIAILRTRTPFTFDATHFPIPLFNAGEESIVGSTSLITGWGTTAEGGNSSPVLMAASVPIVSQTDCNSDYSSWGGLRPGQICAAASEEGRIVCNSDSGSPLAISGRLAGIKSWGNGCARPGSPGVYTEIASYREWISMNIGI